VDGRGSEELSQADSAPGPRPVGPRRGRVLLRGQRSGGHAGGLGEQLGGGCCSGSPGTPRSPGSVGHEEGGSKHIHLGPLMCHKSSPLLCTSPDRRGLQQGLAVLPEEDEGTWPSPRGTSVPN